MIYLLILPVFLCAILLGLIFLSLSNEPRNVEVKGSPKVSILVAARNEAKNIQRCLEALDQLKYSNVEILIGNDHSEDETKYIIEKYIADKPHFQLLDITTTLENTKGKSNVLAQLAKQATGEFYFVTDADTAVPLNWVETMLSAFEEKTAIVTGVTTLLPKTIFHWFQQVDWLYALFMVKVVSDLNLPVTSMGNNMAIRKKAYDQTGGYEKLPFSITEDFQLFKETLKYGWGYKNLFNQQALAISKPIESYSTLLHQRKRWMVGVFQLPWYFLIVLISQALFYPIVIALSIYVFKWGLFLFGLKYILQMVFILRAYAKLNLKVNFVAVVFFEFYSAILSLILGI